MSQWTHVVGCIRIDGLPKIDPQTYTIENIKQILGPICLFGDWNENSTLPIGSEGSLQYEIIEYYSGLPWVVIPIWGDLRDFGPGDTPGIIEWWKNILKQFETKKFIVRDAVFKLEPEGFPETLLTEKQMEED